MLHAQEKHKVRRYHGKLSSYLGDMAPSLRQRLENNRYRFRWSRYERQVMKRRKLIPPSEWAPKHMVVPTGPFEGARMNLSITPHLIGMMDAVVKPYVREVNICAAPQVAKTTFALTVMSWFSVFKPGPALSVYPTETTGTENMEERIQPSYKLSPQLRSLMTGRKEDVSKHKLRLSNMYHRIGWSGSITSLANRSIKLLNLDEVDKYQEKPDKNEAGPVDLAKIRTRTFHDHKIFMMSSPSVETNFIWMAVTKETEALYVFWVRCPHCATEQMMDFSIDSFDWPHKEDGHSFDRMTILSKKLARYVCRDCGTKWDDDDRNRAIQHHAWRLLEGDPLKPESYQEPGEEMSLHMRRTRPRSIGFLIPSWVSRFVSLSEVAHDFLKSQDKESLSPEERFAAYKNFQNKHRSLPWRYELVERPVDAIQALCDDRPAGMVPAGNRVATLLAGVDTQDDCFYLSIWAIGWGHAREMWLVRREKIDSFAALAIVLWDSEYLDAEGNKYFVELVFQDMLGHRTSEVYDFCIQYDGLIFPTFGKRDMPTPYAFSQREFYPGTDKPIPGGLRAVKINTKWYKDRLAIKLNVDPTAPGGIHLYHDTDLDFCNQMISEARDEKGYWQQIGNRANHYWDTLVLVSVAADYLGVQYRERPEDQEGEEEDDNCVIQASSDYMGR